MNNLKITTIAALSSENRGIGKDGDLPWHIPEDLKRFKRLTVDHPVIMGRKTWESIPQKYRPLPDRTNIILTRSSDYTADGAVVCNSLPSALKAAAEHDEVVYIIGGESVYKKALELEKVDRLELTFVEGTFECDTFFPEFGDEFKEVAREEYSDHSPPFTFCTFEKK